MPMNPSCEHKRETLVHGLESLMVARTEIGERPPTPNEEMVQPSYQFLAGVFNRFRDHEAKEVGLYSEAHGLLMAAAEKTPTAAIYDRLIGLQDAFIDRALAALIECECGRT